MTAQQAKEPEPVPWVRPATAPAFEFPIKASKARDTNFAPPPASPGEKIKLASSDSSPADGASNSEPATPVNAEGRSPKFPGSRGALRPKSSQGAKSKNNFKSSTRGGGPTIKRQFKPLNVTSTIGQQSKASNQHWIPELVRTRQIRRDLSVAKQNVETTMVREEAKELEASRHKLNALELSKSKEKFGIEHKVACGCCCMQFLPLNLTLSVPLKAILDIRDSWGVKFDPKGASNVRINQNLRKAPLCYDEVKVCAFCSQLFMYQQEIYRPSWEAKEAEKTRLREEAEMSARKAYWDPLTTTENERKREMEQFILRRDRGESWMDSNSGAKASNLPMGESLRLSRKTRVRTTSSGRIVRERTKTEVSVPDN